MRGFADGRGWSVSGECHLVRGWWLGEGESTGGGRVEVEMED